MAGPEFTRRQVLIAAGAAVLLPEACGLRRNSDRTTRTQDRPTAPRTQDATENRITPDAKEVGQDALRFMQQTMNPGFLSTIGIKVDAPETTQVGVQLGTVN